MPATFVIPDPVPGGHLLFYIEMVMPAFAGMTK